MGARWPSRLLGLMLPSRQLPLPVLRPVLHRIWAVPLPSSQWRSFRWRPETNDFQSLLHLTHLLPHPAHTSHSAWTYPAPNLHPASPPSPPLQHPPIIASQPPPTLAGSSELKEALDIHVNILQALLKTRRPWTHVYIYAHIHTKVCELHHYIKRAP